ncbi:MAG: proton-conducting transporter transmembrane domain-containing protein, partial [Hyphococcus sp.]
MPAAILSALPVFAMLLLLGAAALGGSAGPARARRLAEGGAAAALAAAALAGLGLAANGFAADSAIGGLFRIDALSAVMFVLVSFVGFVVARFSGNYLDGDPRQPVFLARLCLTLAAVTALVTAGNLIVLFAAWVATSLSLHTLLLFRSERPGAIVAARKKFIVARIGDACLAIAVAALIAAFGTANIGEIAAAAKLAQASGEAPVSVGVAAAMIALAAALKSAQFPTHGWLTEVMETPTPVSALLHAGVVNAGGFLVIRFADVMLLNLPAMHVLALIGGFTALFGCIVMLTQTSVKVALAYSTVAQMGFMLLQCGLGAFSSAALHLVAHSLYKAYAFLSSGRAVTAVGRRKTPARA